MFSNADVIYSYSRAQAIEDGVLVDVSGQAKEAGIIYPVAITANAWHTWIVPDKKGSSNGQSVSGRLWNLFMIFRVTARSTVRDVRYFSVYFLKNGRLRFGTFKAVCGPGDGGEPVITIMLPEED